jgi:predicted ester cyclase
MTSRVESIRAAVAALNRGDVDGYLQSFDVDSKRYLSGSDQPLSYGDINNGVTEMLSAFVPFVLEEEAIFGDEHSVCARWRIRGTQVAPFMGVPSVGATIDVQTCEIYEFEGDLVTVSYVYGDHGEMFRQMAVPGE